MTLTTKETDLLKDLKTQEQLFIDKYTRYSQQACDTGLKNLFDSICTTERTHLQTVTDILGGAEPHETTAPTATTAVYTGKSTCDETSKQNDAYLCRDALAMEKHVSSVYDTCVFEFANPKLRDTLAHIQKEEQNHGEQLYTYLASNGLYNSYEESSRLRELFSRAAPLCIY